MEKSINKELERISEDKDRWGVISENFFHPSSKTMVSLPSGMYRVSDHERFGIVYKKEELFTDDIIRIDGSISDVIVKEVFDFWEKGDEYIKRGFVYSRGYLLYGPTGSGKTCVIDLIIKDIIERNGIVFVCERPWVFNEAVSTFKKIEPDRKIVCIFEDIEAIIKEFGEYDVLSFLDGEKKMNNVLNIATTNYPEVLNKRVANRPRRFDRVIYIGNPSYMERLTYFNNKLKNKKEAEKWANDTDDFSYAFLAELVIRVKCLGVSYEKTITELISMKHELKSIEDKEDFGFLIDNGEERELPQSR